MLHDTMGSQSAKSRLWGNEHTRLNFLHMLVEKNEKEKKRHGNYTLKDSYKLTAM